MNEYIYLGDDISIKQQKQMPCIIKQPRLFIHIYVKRPSISFHFLIAEKNIWVKLIEPDSSTNKTTIFDETHKSFVEPKSENGNYLLCSKNNYRFEWKEEIVLQLKNKQLTKLH